MEKYWDPKNTNGAVLKKGACLSPVCASVQYPNSNGGNSRAASWSWSDSQHCQWLTIPLCLFSTLQRRIFLFISNTNRLLAFPDDRSLLIDRQVKKNKKTLSVCVVGQTIKKWLFSYSACFHFILFFNQRYYNLHLDLLVCVCFHKKRVVRPLLWIQVLPQMKAW